MFVLYVLCVTIKWIYLQYTDEMKITTTVIGQILLILFTLFLSNQLIFGVQHWTLLDYVNLLIHEGGHMLFLPFGEFMNMLGGSFTQILVPCLFFVYFFLRKEFASAGFIIFWIANNIVSVSVYMSDAIEMQLPLVGGEGVIHDWNWLFSRMGLLQQSGFIASVFYSIGIIGVIVSIVWMAIFTFIEMKDKNTNVLQSE